VKKLDKPLEDAHNNEPAEIEASGDLDAGGGGEPAEQLLEKQYQDALAEVGNISLGAAATALSKLVNRLVQITTPKVNLLTLKEVRSNYPIPCLVVTVNYLKGLEGENVLIVRKDDALKIVGLMMGMEPPERPEDLGELELSAIGEAMNQMMGSAATAMSDLFSRSIDISPPQVRKKDLKTESVELDSLDEDSIVIQVAFRMVVENLLDSELLQLIPLEYGRKVASSLLATLVSGMAAEITAPAVQEAASPEGAVVAPEDVLTPVVKKDNVFSVREEAETPSGLEAKAKNQGLRREEFEKINLIKDIPIEINAILGKARLPLKRVFSLSPGEIIALENYLGEPVELYANNQLVAKGEVVLVNSQFGVKITNMVRSGPII
jgi:flagellar motor switch protein FliN/FliY